jgi:hypothetical protein
VERLSGTESLLGLPRRMVGFRSAKVRWAEHTFAERKATILAASGDRATCSQPKSD